MRSIPRRRRRLPLPIGAALGMVLAGTFVLLPGQEQAAPPDVHTEQVDLTQPAEPVAPGWSGEAEVAPELVGVEWQGDPAAAFTIETRDPAGAWSVAGTIEAQSSEEGPDAGSADAAGAAANVTEPIWIGADVTGVRVRLDEGVAADVDLHAVDSPPAEGAPGAAVAADGGSLSASSARMRIAFAVGVSAIAVLVLWALAPRPRRRRRVAAGMLLVLAVGLTGCLRGAPPPPRPPSVPPLSSIITRSQWGADENLRLTNCPNGPDYMTDMNFAVVHHTVNSNDYTAAQGPQLVRAIYAYHTQSLGYCDIAYNFLIDRFGNTYEGRYGGTNQAVMGAHALGFNTHSTGVALIGDYRTTKPSAESIEAVKLLLVWKFQVHSVDPRTFFYYQTTGNEKYAAGSSVYLAPVSYHQATGSTACPGDQVIAKINEIYQDVATRMGY